MPKGGKRPGSGRKAKEEGNALLITRCATFSELEIDRVNDVRGSRTWAAWLREAAIEKLDRTNDGKKA